MLAQPRTKFHLFASVVSGLNRFGGIKLGGGQSFLPQRITKQQQLHMGSMQSKAYGQPMISASHILTKDEKTANIVVERVNSGEDFEVVASELSECPSKSQGGSLGWIGKGRMAPEFETAAFDKTKPPGNLIKVHTSSGWHVLRVDERKTTEPPQDMSVQELVSILKSRSEDIQLVDVREEDELRIASLSPTLHVVHLPLSTYQQQILSASEKLDPSKETVVFCHKGVRSKRFANLLCSQGCFPGKVYNLSGGIHAYSAIDSTVAKY